MTRIVTVDPSVGELVRKNGGYCPCATVKDEDTRCICVKDTFWRVAKR